MGEELNKEEVTIGLSPDGEVAIITIPIAKYALNDQDGAALIYGKMREIQAHVMQMANQIKIKRAQRNGILRPDGNLQVN